MDVATLSTVLDSALKSMQAEGCSLRNFRLERGARCTTILIEFVHIANQTWFEVGDRDETERSLKVCHCRKSLSSSRETISDKVGCDNTSLTSDDSQLTAPVAPSVVMCDVERNASSAGQNSVDKGCNTDSEPDTLSIASEAKSTEETSPIRVIPPGVNVNTNSDPVQTANDDTTKPLCNGKSPTAEVAQSPCNGKLAKGNKPTTVEAQLHRNGKPEKENTPATESGRVYCNGKPAIEKTPSTADTPITYIDQQDTDAERKRREGYAKSKGRSLSTTSDSSMLNQEEMKRQEDNRRSKPRSLSITIDELQNKESMQLKDDGKAKQRSPLLKPNKNMAEPTSPKNKSPKPAKQSTNNSTKTKENRPPASKPPMPGPKPVAPPVAQPTAEADNDETDEDEDVLISQVVKKWSAIRGKKGLF